MSRRGRNRKSGRRTAAVEPIKRKEHPRPKPEVQPWEYRHANRLGNSDPLRKMPGPRVAGVSGAVSRSEVERRVLNGMRTLRALPDKERRFFILKSAYPDYVHEHIDAYNSVEALIPAFVPSPFDVSDYLEALSWARHLDKRDWRILWWRSFDYSFGLIAKQIGRSDETVRRRYRDILTDVWCAANGVAA